MDDNEDVSNETSTKLEDDGPAMVGDDDLAKVEEDLTSKTEEDLTIKTEEEIKVIDEPKVSESESKEDVKTTETLEASNIEQSADPESIGDGDKIIKETDSDEPIESKPEELEEIKAEESLLLEESKEIECENEKQAESNESVIEKLKESDDEISDKKTDSDDVNCDNPTHSDDLIHSDTPIDEPNSENAATATYIIESKDSENAETASSISDIVQCDSPKHVKETPQEGIKENTEIVESEKNDDAPETSKELPSEPGPSTQGSGNQDIEIEIHLESSQEDPEIRNDGDKEVQKPEFETAPNVSMEDTHEDHTQALDPFDTLLRDLPDPPAETSTQTADVDTMNIDDDDDDDHNVENHVDQVDGEDDHQDEGSLAEPGADEEVCLLPDTEREISEADKQEAEKVLAEKRRQAEEAMSSQVPEANVVADIEPESSAEMQNTNATSTDEVVVVDGNENGGEERENKDPDEIDTNDETSLTVKEVPDIFTQCQSCSTQQPCKYLFILDDKEQYYCSEVCIKALQTHFNEKSIVILKDKYIIDEIVPIEHVCSECEETKICYFYYKYDGEDTYYCSLKCLKSMMADESEKYTFKRLKIFVEQIKQPRQDIECVVCNEVKACLFTAKRYGSDIYLCDAPCLKILNEQESGRYSLCINKKLPTPLKPQPLLKLKVISNATDKYLDEAYKIQAKTPDLVQAAREEREQTFIRLCAHCYQLASSDDKMLTWETMDFCNKVCLGRYQHKNGSKCAYCKSVVALTSLGKYCVRFGYDIRQFCNSRCLEEFKKGLKICCYCQRDISVGHEGFLAPVGDKGQFKDFCTQVCMEKFDQMSKNTKPQPVWAKCAVCSLEKGTTIEVEVMNICQRLCSDPCFAAFKFVNNIVPDQCRWCKKYFERTLRNCFTIYEGTKPIPFCTKSCMNIFISNSRHIVPCNWCKVKKYNYDMIQWSHDNQMVMMCSLSCLNLYEVSVNAVSSRRKKCDMCKQSALAQYHLTMSDATVRNFCSYQCVITFQGQYSKEGLPMVGEPTDTTKAVPTGAPRRTYSHKGKGKALNRASTGMPVISNVQSLATPPPVTTPTRTKSKRLQQIQGSPEPEPPAAPATPPPPPKPPTPPPPPPPKIYNHVIVKTLPPHEVANKATMSKPMMVSKGVSCRPHPCTKECQTDPSLERRVLIPVPVPIYVPVPCAMWSLPFPVPVPIPLPIPTPVFIPTTRNSAKGIMKEINKIHDKMPTDPFEAELLMMAEMVAGDKKKDQSDSDTDEENEGFSPVAGMDGNNAFGEDMLQMALKMATEYEEQPVDLESAMTANTITPSSHPGMPGLEGEGIHHHHMMVLEQQRAVAALRASQPARKRAPPAAAPAPTPRASRSSKRRREPAPPPPEPPREPAEKPDANMCLKYTFGVNAWKQWVMTKNAEIEKSSIRRKPFKSEILQLTSDELNYSLCLFVKEVRKPNGSEYAPDTIYYLVLGIQQYLFENGRIDNIFTDTYYEKFTDCLDEVARKFSVLYNDSQYIVTRVEEEHLWESKQLGAHSPHVLLSTLMFFNTKHFNLVTVDEHMQLSFSHIMKHWKRNPNQPGQAKIPGARNVLLRFYPPQSALEANSRKKKVYEQQENEENPLRCPVKLYEFYISKCPESVRTRNDVFYLQPERSCVPDSPVWYSTQPLTKTTPTSVLMENIRDNFYNVRKCLGFVSVPQTSTCR
ncbi:unnamed protein product [Leptosia nina]|uniref:TRASH domain-containing protein n=1 Tax=Leptosia nina TaxID=320188 RepID=A0AAV1JC86_9NEOP